MSRAPAPPANGYIMRQRPYPDVQVGDYGEASRVFQQRRDTSGKGNRDFPEAELYVYNGATPVARVSYNGRVWCATYRGNIHTAPLLYDPQGTRTVLPQRMFDMRQDGYAHHQVADFAAASRVMRERFTAWCARYLETRKPEYPEARLYLPGRHDVLGVVDADGVVWDCVLPDRRANVPQAKLYAPPPTLDPVPTDPVNKILAHAASQLDAMGTLTARQSDLLERIVDHINGRPPRPDGSPEPDQDLGGDRHLATITVNGEEAASVAFADGGSMRVELGDVTVDISVDDDDIVHVDGYQCLETGAVDPARLAGKFTSPL